MFRPITLADTNPIIELTIETGVFKPLEIITLREVLGDYHKEDRELGHRAFVWEEAGKLLAYAYYAPTEMTDRAWHLYWIAVARDLQGRGLGRKLLEFVEDDIRGLRGRMLMIETSTLPHYDPTRRFYLKYGYEQIAQVPDYYADGDGMVVYVKRLAPLEARGEDRGAS